MPLLSLYATNPETIHLMNILQIVSSSGDGNLLDATEAQMELREYFKLISIDQLAKYADHCLTKSFIKSGLVLQDIVNELGSRLEYNVTNGLYQGRTNAIGYDGIWKDPSGNGIIVEVKTTDAYRIPLDTIAKYRNKLIETNVIQTPCSILIVVGRADTGELEAQVRGSRHSWDIRIISVDSLINLVRTKESADSSETGAKIRKILTPLEYTRLDELIDIVFSTTQDVVFTSSQDIEVEETPENATTQVLEVTTGSGWVFTPLDELEAVRKRIISTMGVKYGFEYIRKTRATRATYWDESNHHRLVCSISKRYNNSISKYWYAYHREYMEFLQNGEDGFFVLGCMDIDIAFSLPISLLNAHLDSFNTSNRRDGTGVYFHIKINEPTPNKFELQLPRTGGTLSIDQYIIPMILNVDINAGV